MHLKRSDVEDSQEKCDQISKKTKFKEDWAEYAEMKAFVQSIIDNFDDEGPGNADFSEKFDVEKFRDHFAKQKPINGKVGPYLCPRTGDHWYAPREETWLKFAEDRSVSFNRKLFHMLVEFFVMKWTYRHLQQVLSDAKTDAPICSTWAELKVEFDELEVIDDIAYTLISHQDCK